MSSKIVSKYLSLCLLLTVFDYCLCSNSNTISSETPGFFLKVTKNVPRLGRRSHQLSDFENFFLKTSKSVPRIGRSDNNMEGMDKRDVKHYNSVQPFDSKSLHHLLATEDVNENDIKFISWDSFDLALENDEGLFSKLLSLANDELSMPMLAQKLVQDTFVPLPKSQNPVDSYFYRITRDATQHE
ncbi:uncharacterized protein LOC116345341 [Contarinia nasturtii]|uniref:uncharacterized protein LOC116345341 n=1 Tax=Contarinia nasturtii TaxID=265458 RepID=UPI0012D42145|nr:uncharacterized protein LOC116345341 [Contarinia nasturtii]